MIVKGQCDLGFVRECENGGDGGERGERRGRVVYGGGVIGDFDTKCFVADLR